MDEPQNSRDSLNMSGGIICLQDCVNKYLVTYPFDSFKGVKVYQKKVYLYEFEDLDEPMFNEYILVIQDNIIRIYEVD